jgi:hypothetical protein
MATSITEATVATTTLAQTIAVKASSESGEEQPKVEAVEEQPKVESEAVNPPVEKTEETEKPTVRRAIDEEGGTTTAKVSPISPSRVPDMKD